MAEYLAPGVYVEEVDMGPKPIEGASTSTAGMVGMAERGPTDVPILLTSSGDYARWFGGTLPIADFSDGAGRPHCYLPHSVEGFFTNGGKRLYAVRVAPAEAARATVEMFDHGAPGGGATVLLRGAAQGTGAGVGLYVLDAAGIANGDRIRVGDGSRAEYPSANVVTAGTSRHIALDAPLSRAHAAGAPVREHAANALAGVAGPWTLASPAAAGSSELFVDSPDNLTAPALPWLVQMVNAGVTDLAAVTAVVASGANQYRLVINQPLTAAHATGQALTLLQSQAVGARVLETAAVPGELMLFATANGGAAGQIIEIDRGGADHEVRLSGALSQLPLAQPNVGAVAAGAVVESVTLANAAPTPKALTAPARAGSRTLSLNDRVGLVEGQWLRIGAAPIEEFARVVSVPGDRAAAPDAGTVTLAQPLLRDRVAAVVQALDPPAVGPRPRGHVVVAAAAGTDPLLVTRGTGWVAGDFARVRLADGSTFLQRLDGAAVAATPGLVTLAGNLLRTHGAGEAAVERQPLFRVEALDVGGWGNRLLVSVEEEPAGLAATATTALAPPLQITVASLTGIEAGSLLEVTNPDTGASVMMKVRRTDRAASAVTLDGAGLDAAAMAALGAIVNPLVVRSREFRLSVQLRRRPDPAVPSRNNQIIGSELFRHLSMDSRHSRYFERVIGAVNGTLRLEDGRPEGESGYVRVADLAPDVATLESIRPGPEALVDALPGGGTQPARHALGGGDDALSTMADTVYLGADAAEPRLRTGLASLRNVPEISIVAVPGQTGANLQSQLIAHCETMRYRFAVLDSTNGQASLADVQAQRQLFDSKYAAIYYPWLTVPDPMPDTLALVRDFALPPSGHVIGIYARTDEERGVHKAPANEVVRGVTGLTRSLQKGEQDILNPSPVNINVIRDFRPDGRSIRVWGARCITSDQQHKYVPVRRLLIFLEQSIERGLQWVVFEPNGPELWARVTQTVEAFLTDVWRAGALEGREPAQGFFVRCDETTMTASDRTNGRLIIVAGVAPVMPAEFVIFRIGLTTLRNEE